MQSDKKDLENAYVEFEIRGGWQQLSVHRKVPVVFSGWRDSQQVSNFIQENILLWSCSMSQLTDLWLAEACSKLRTMKVPLNLCITTKPLRTLRGAEVGRDLVKPLWPGRASQAQLPRTVSR